MEQFTISYAWEIIVRVFVSIFGAIVGSFLNVCIYRMPREESIVRPRSHCINCNKLIRWYDNIPLLSFIALGGKCRNCGKKISFQYFVVELLTGLTFITFYLTFGLSPKAIIYTIFVCGLIVSTFVDFNFRIIPDEISLGGIVLGLIFGLVYPQLHGGTNHLIGLYRSFIGVIVGGGIIWVTGIIGDFVFKKETMGGGDVKLLGMIGAFLGWKLALITFFCAPIFGSIVGIIIKLKTKSSLIAYGPYLSLAAVISIFLGRDIINWVFMSKIYYY